MTKTSFIAAIAVILAMPLVYILLNGFEQEESLSFRGVPVITLEASDGSLVVPTAAENKKGVAMRAKLSAAYVEKTSGLKLPFYEPLDLIIDSVSNKVSACAEDGSTPAQASFDVAATCAESSFQLMNLERKTKLQVEPQDQFIIFGATANNQVKLFYNNIIASYVSKDMTQGDRKREACIVRILLDHLLGKPANVESSCTPAVPG
jgi:hypothetical protein